MPDVTNDKAKMKAIGREQPKEQERETETEIQRWRYGKIEVE